MTRANLRIISDDDVRAAPDKPLIDSITVGEGSAASVHFLSYVHRPPINPGTDFYVEYTEEEHAGSIQPIAGCPYFCAVWTNGVPSIFHWAEGRQRG